MQIGGIIAIVVAAAVSAAAIVSLGLGLGLGLGLRKPCAVATTQRRITPTVDYVCFDDKLSAQVPLRLSGTGYMKIGKTLPTVTVFTDSSPATYYPTTSLESQCPYEGQCVVTAILSKKDLLRDSALTTFTAFVDNPDPCYTVNDATLTSFKSKMNGQQLTAVYLSVSNVAPNTPLSVSTTSPSGFGNTITISGSGFIATKNTDNTWNYPTITLTSIHTNEQITVPGYAASDCKTISNNQVFSCNTLQVRLYGNNAAATNDPNSLPLGKEWYNKDLTFSVTNTAISQNNTCSSSSSDYSNVDQSKRVFLFETPVITSLSNNTLCTLNATTITLRGSAFIIKQNADSTWSLPSVTIADQPMTLTKESFSACNNMIANSLDSKMYPADTTLQQCQQITFTIPANLFSSNMTGDLPIMVKNPAPFSSSITGNNLLTISPSYCPTPIPIRNITCPLISNFTVVPTEGHLTFCASPMTSARQSITINGSGFNTTSRVKLIYVGPLVNASYPNGINGSNIDMNTTRVILEADSIQVVNSTRLIASFHRDVPHGMYIVNVTNIDEDECQSATHSEQLAIYPIRYYTYANPSFVYNLMNTQVDVTTFGFKQNEFMLALLMPDYGNNQFGDAIVVPFKTVSDSKVVITIPNTLTNGSYQVIMVAHDGCGTQPVGPNILISNQTKFEVSSVTPNTMESGANVNLRVLTTGQPGVSKSALVYFSNAESSAQLQNVQVADDGQSLTATAPLRIASGVYDIIVVNPDGTIGTGSRLMTVTNDTVGPKIFSVTPNHGSISTLGVIEGMNFAQDVQIELYCAGENGTYGVHPVPVLSESPTRLQVTIPFNAPVAGSACDVRATNPSTGLKFMYTGITTDHAGTPTPSAAPVTTAVPTTSAPTTSEPTTSVPTTSTPTTTSP